LADLKELYICIKFGSNCEKSWKLLASVCALVCVHQEVIDEMKTILTLEDHKKSILVYCKDPETKWQSFAVVKPVFSMSKKK